MPGGRLVGDPPDEAHAPGLVVGVALLALGFVLPLRTARAGTGRSSS